MSLKRDCDSLSAGPLVPNPFIKKRNLEWAIGASSPPHSPRANSGHDEPQEPAEVATGKSEAAAVEAGETQVKDHLAYFSQLLTKAIFKGPHTSASPCLTVEGYRDLYKSQSGQRSGAHFVIHQHDHPVAGTHYDLRLQINETSSASWAIMYGLPGDPNSQRLNRNATETRVHCLWNHLIETASAATGSLLIWDTGTYTVLARRSKHAPTVDPDSQSSSESDDGLTPQPSEQERLHAAFQTRKIKLELHGSRLPSPYVVNLRLTKDEDAAGRNRSTRATKRRQRRGGNRDGPQSSKQRMRFTSSDSEDNAAEAELQIPEVAADTGAEEGLGAPAEKDPGNLSAMEKEIREVEDEEVRRTNAYPGASNTIGSVHQRRWYLSLDREACGFSRGRKEGKVFWSRNPDRTAEASDESEGVVSRSGEYDYPFYVRGVVGERSVITGRLGADVLRDEGVDGYVGRKGWRPILN